MKCPICGYPQYCPCESCQNSIRHCTPKGFKPWIWISGTGTPADGECITCAGCGYTAHADWWEEQDLLQNDPNSFPADYKFISA